MSAAMLIAATEAQHACENEPNIDERIRKAMRATKDHYLLTGEVHRIQAACAGAAMASKDKTEKDHIIASCRSLVDLNNMLAAAIAGVPVAFEEIPEPKPNMLPIMALWQEIKGEGGV